VYAGEKTARWNPGASILRMRWVEDDVWFEITKSGSAEEIGYLDQAGLVDLAERLVTQP
jgi:hypothetical protein